MLLRIACRIGALLLVPAIVLAFLSLLSRRPAAVGLVEGRLRECPNTMSCVSSQTSRAARSVEPVSFTGSPEDAQEELRRVVAGLPNTRIVASSGDYLHAECRSRLFRFIDDVELVIDRRREVFHCRSASRVGYYDFGVNRRRIEEIRRRFAAANRAGSGLATDERR